MVLLMRRIGTVYTPSLSSITLPGNFPQHQDHGLLMILMDYSAIGPELGLPGIVDFTLIAGELFSEYFSR